MPNPKRASSIGGMSRDFTRRELLELGAGAVAAGTVLVRCGGGGEGDPDDGAQLVPFSVESWHESPEDFPLGVSVGAMTDTSALLWTYTTHEKVYLYVFRPAEESFRVWLAKEVELEPVGGYVKVRVEGLGPSYYEYLFTTTPLLRTEDSPLADVAEAVFVRDGTRSRVGRFRTAFADGDSRRLVIAGLTCSSLRNRPFVALDLATEAKPDVLLHMGDMSYNDEAENLAEYREKWRQTLSEPEYQRVLSTAGLYMTWDDHEITNDFNPEFMAAEQPDRLAAAKQAFFETLPIERGENDRLWRSYRWGKTAEIFVVDSRSERKPSTRTSDDPIYVSKEQMAWLKRGLQNSPAKYKLVMNSVPMATQAAIWDFAAFDRWAGYEKQRQELIDHLVDNEIENVVFLSGDFHCGFIGRLEKRGPASKYFEIAVGPTGNGPNPLPLLAESGDLPVEEIFPPDQYIFFSGSDKAMTFLDIDPNEETFRVRFVDARPDRYGEVLFDQEISQLWSA